MTPPFKEFFHGSFFLPDSENTVSGNLSISYNNEVKLTTLGDFDNLNEKKLINAFKFYQEIHGIAYNEKTEKQTFIYLFGVQRNQYQVGYIERHFFSVRYVFVGDSINGLTRFSGKRLLLSNEFLNFWTGSHGISVREDKNNGLGVSFTKIPSISLFSDSILDINLLFSSEYSIKTKRDLHLVEKVYLEVVSFQNFDKIETVFRIKYILESFLTTLFAKRIEFNSLLIFNSEEAEFLYANNSARNSDYFTKKDFQFEEFKRRSNAFFKNWFSLFNVQEVLLDTFYNAFFDDKKTKKSYFLTTVFCLEMIYRLTYPNTPERSSYYLKMRNKIMAKLKDEEEEDWFAKRHKLTHEPPLREKLEVLFKDNQEPILQMSVTDFSKKTANTRNALAHLDISEKDILNEVETWQATLFFSDYIENYFRNLILTE